MHIMDLWDDFMTLVAFLLKQKCSIILSVISTTFYISKNTILRFQSVLFFFLLLAYTLSSIENLHVSDFGVWGKRSLSEEQKQLERNQL